MKTIAGHWKQLSDVCADDGVGCDGYEYGEVGGPTPCDCPCHSVHAPMFITNDDVRKWHE